MENELAFGKKQLSEKNVELDNLRVDRATIAAQLKERSQSLSLVEASLQDERQIRLELEKKLAVIAKK